MKKLRLLLLSWETLLLVWLLICLGLGGILSPYFWSGFNFYALTSNAKGGKELLWPITAVPSLL